MSAYNEKRALHPRTGTRLPVVLVLVCLALAILLPRLAQRRVNRLRDQINLVADPARADVEAVELDLALESAARRGYALTSDPELAREITVSLERRRQAEHRLRVAGARLDSAVPAAVAALGQPLSAFDSMMDSLEAMGVPRTNPSAALHRRQPLLDATLTASQRLDSAIVRTADARRADIAATENAAAVLTAALVLLGLGAAMLVARLGNRERAARAAADQRRLDLEKVTESRTRLLRGFTHDVKNPLGAADGFLALLEQGVQGTLAQPQQDWVARARRAIGHALELIRQLLDLARAEAGELTLQSKSTDIAELVQDVAEAFRAQAAAKSLAIAVDIPARLPCVTTDAMRVRQVVGNLVSNAVKYTPSGGHIAVCTCVKDAGTGPPTRRIEVAVTDDGPGIQEEQLPRLFSEFTRFDPDAAEGPGIGLAISQRIAHALGGAISVESRVGQGSTFTLLLPIAGEP